MYSWNNIFQWLIQMDMSILEFKNEHEEVVEIQNNLYVMLILIEVIHINGIRFIIFV